MMLRFIADSHRAERPRGLGRRRRRTCRPSGWPRDGRARAALESADEIIADPSIDAVWICTPTAMHRQICIAAARAGKHIFCEKPLAMTAAEAAEMAAAIKASGVLSQVGLVMRFSPVYSVIKAMFEAPDVGQMLSVTMRDDQDFPTRGAHASAWRNDPSLTAGGTLVEHSVHDFDLLTWMFGPVARLYCRTRNLNGAPGSRISARPRWSLRGGFHGQLTSIWHRMIARASNRRLEVFAENLFAASDADTLGPIVFQRGARRHGRDDWRRRSDGPVHRKDSARAAVPRADQGSSDDSLRGRGRDLRRRIARRMRAGAAEFAAGVAVQRIVEAAYESARARRRRWPD